jgi:hypothetical protein
VKFPPLRKWHSSVLCDPMPQTWNPPKPVQPTRTADLMSFYRSYGNRRRTGGKATPKGAA